MSKFCANCGNMMNDTDMVCSVCGTPCNNQTQQQYGAPVQNAGYDPYGAPVQNNAYDPYGAPAQNNGYDPYAGYGAQAQGMVAPANKYADLIKKYLPVAAGALAVIVVLIIIIACAGGGYKKVIKKYVKAMFSDDADTIAKYTSIIETDGDDPDSDDYDYGVGLATAFFEDEYGEFKSVKIKIKDVDKYDKDEIEDFVEDNCDDVDPDDIKKIYEIEADLTIKGEDDDVDEEDTEDVTFYMSKEKGGWKVIDFEGLI